MTAQRRLWSARCTPTSSPRAPRGYLRIMSQSPPRCRTKTGHHSYEAWRKCPACGPRLTRQRKSLSAALPTGQNPEGVTAPQMIADWSDIHALRTAAAHPDAEVRAAVAANRFTPPSVLAQMSGDLSSRVRAEVGGNPKTPPRTLSRMARNGDEVSEVTERVAANPLTPQRSLTYLSKRATFWGEFHPSSVRAQVASNPAAPQTVLDRLVVDESPLVRRAALRYTRLPMNAVPRVDAGGDFDDMAALVLPSPRYRCVGFHQRCGRPPRSVAECLVRLLLERLPDSRRVPPQRRVEIPGKLLFGWQRPTRVHPRA